jgi:E3 ubiquitin-protein ligase RHA2
MGLQSQLSDVSSESIPILLVALIANCLGYLRSLLFNLLKSLRFSNLHSDQIHAEVFDGAIGSGLAGLILLSEQLNLNLGFSYRYGKDNNGCGSGKECVVCLNRLSNGDRVRKLACGHVFHKDCLDGWLDHLNFNCPLCRFPLVTKEHVALTEKRVTSDIVTWFSLR